ncbi:MAG: glutamine-hydrolyzing carbamoyl-phosphate synthase small subunit [bacterium]|nr:glutamine-hydrolyzing carbamoyl-phosphate synthase small subunit [bacterium]
MKALLVLEDGTFFEGRSFGSREERTGEVVFNTSMTGYQEILTDPSYRGQIVTMTYPHIGNYGLNETDIESRKPWVEAFIAKEFSRVFSNVRGTSTIEDYLIKNNISGIEGVDTRAITRHIRTKGAMKGGIFVGEELNIKTLIKRVKLSPDLVGRDLVKEVTCQEPYHWNDAGKYKVICYDFGIKYNQLRDLANLGCSLKIVPAQTQASEILSENPDGVFLSNGPGDPEAVTYAAENIKKLIGKVPVFGICLGHQLLGLALGGKTYKLKFGHHGANQPVKDLTTGKIEITTQNHGFAVDMNSLDKNKVEVTHINLNDQTVEGIKHKTLPVFSVQYHPEAGPGPHDSKYLFGRFVEMMERGK